MGSRAGRLTLNVAEKVENEARYILVLNDDSVHPIRNLFRV